MSGEKALNQPGDTLLQKIKAKAFEVDIFLLLDRDVSASFTLKDLLSQAWELDFPSEVSKVIIVLGLMLNHIIANINRVRDTSTTILSKLQAQISE